MSEKQDYFQNEAGPCIKQVWESENLQKKKLKLLKSPQRASGQTSERACIGVEEHAGNSGAIRKTCCHAIPDDRSRW